MMKKTLTLLSLLCLVTVSQAYLRHQLQQEEEEQHKQQHDAHPVLQCYAVLFVADARLTTSHIVEYKCRKYSSELVNIVQSDVIFVLREPEVLTYWNVDQRIQQLLEQAESHIPSSRVPYTPIMFAIKEDLRDLLDQEQYLSLMDQVNLHLRNSKFLYFPFNVQSISTRDMITDAWKSYMLLAEISRQHLQEIALIDISQYYTSIAFQSSPTSLDIQHHLDFTHVQGRNNDTIFTGVIHHSINQTRAEVLRRFTQDGENPCFLKGDLVTYANEITHETLHARGTGDFNSCFQHVESLFPGKDCKPEDPHGGDHGDDGHGGDHGDSGHGGDHGDDGHGGEDSGNGGEESHGEDENNNGRRNLGLKNRNHRVEQETDRLICGPNNQTTKAYGGSFVSITRFAVLDSQFTAKSQYELSEIKDRAQQICGKEKSQMEDDTSHRETVSSYCFDAIYLYHLLSRGYQFKYQYFTVKYDSQDIDWINEFMAEKIQRMLCEYENPKCAHV